MNNFQVFARITSRALAATGRRRMASMKEAFDPAVSKGVVPNSAGYKKMQSLQAAWSLDHSTLVWQKRAIDAPLYYITMGLAALGAGYILYGFAIMSFPKKQN